MWSFCNSAYDLPFVALDPFSKGQSSNESEAGLISGLENQKAGWCYSCRDMHSFIV